MTFDARHPDRSAPAFDVSHTEPHLAAARLRPDLLHKVGEAFAVALSRLLRLLVPDGGGAISADALQTVAAEVARLERLGVQLQEIARVLAGEGRWILEPVDVAVAVRQSIAQWTDRAALSGVALAGPQAGPTLELTAPVLEQLLELGLEYGLHIGERVTIDCNTPPSAAAPGLVFDIHRAPVRLHDAAAAEIDDLQWLLFVTLARAAGWTPRRQTLGDAVRLAVTFVPPEALTAPSAAELPTTPVAAGRRVLLVDPQEMSRVQSQRLLNEVGMVVDAVATLAQARLDIASPHRPLPDVLLTGFPTDEPASIDFIDTLRAAQPHLRVVELVDDDSAFTFSVPGPDNPARVGRHTLARTLVPAISQELDAV
jgi:CheY-like chemotaxis protein